MNGDYIPRKDADFLKWMVNMIKYLLPLLEKLGIPPATYELMKSLHNDYATALAATEDSELRNHASIKIKNTARVALEKFMRKTVKQYMTFNQDLTDGERERLFLPVHKTTRTPSPIATVAPKCLIDTSVARRLTLKFFDPSNATSKAKPPGQHGVELCYAILDQFPSDLSALIHTDFDTNSPLVLQFKEHDRGKTIYFSVRWVNTRSQRGPWSPIDYTVIP
jgi:hypothetical protein